jgi:carbonic anhydrase
MDIALASSCIMLPFGDRTISAGCQGRFFDAEFSSLDRKVIMKKIALLLAALLASAPAQAKDIIWTYGGLTDGEDSWGDLSPEFAACSKGHRQSPVVISNTLRKKLPKLSFNFRTVPTELSLHRYSLVMTPKEKLTMNEGDKELVLREMLIRTPSEHMIGEDYFPIELQFMFDDQYLNRTIVSVFLGMTRDTDNKALQALNDAVAAKQELVDLDWSLLVPATTGYYAYPGSISYPPCTEDANIRVLKTMVDASPPQVKAMTKKLGRNARMTQPVYIRSIEESMD